MEEKQEDAKVEAQYAWQLTGDKKEEGVFNQIANKFGDAQKDGKINEVKP